MISYSGRGLIPKIRIFYRVPDNEREMDVLGQNQSKSGEIIWNESLEDPFNEIKCMLSVKNLLSCPYQKITLTVHTDASDKQLCPVISQNNKPIDFFFSKLTKPQRNYTTNKKELLEIVE